MKPELETPRTPRRPTRRAGVLRRCLGTATLAVVAVATALGSTIPGTVETLQATPAASSATDPTITFVQANIAKDMGQTKFDQDLATVFAQQPDFITFNEVYARDPAKLAPAGYEMFRTPGPRTGWAPVVWNASEWSAVATGTYQVSNKAPKYRNTNKIVGVRFANWATLVNHAGQTVSVVSVHIAPNDKDTEMLLRPSLERLRALARQLGEQGPVMIGGDFNMGYHSDRYQPEYLADAGLASTYDLLGSSFPTHRRGGTIDYLFLGPVENFSLGEQYPVAMNSDHSALVVKLQLLSGGTTAPLPSFPAGTFRADPRGSKAQRYAVRMQQLKAINATPAGAAVHVASDAIRTDGIYRALSKAVDRGANVTVIAGEKPVTAAGLALRSRLGTDTSSSSYYAVRSGAWNSTAKSGRSRIALRPTVLLISRAGATSAYALLANTNLAQEPTKRTFPRVTTAKVTTWTSAYDREYRAYLSAVGRSY